jgi:site-specific DNA-methyltransferase (adenine-specific)
MSEIKLYHDDCLNVLKQLDNDSVDLVLTDVPYGVDFKNDFFDDSKEYVFTHYEQWISEMHRVLKEGSHCYIFIPTLEVDKWVYMVKKYFTFKNIITARIYTTGNYLKNNFSYNSQFVIYCSKGKAKPFNKVDAIKTSQAWLKDKRNKNPKPYTYNYPSFMPDYFFSNVKGNCKHAVHPNQKNVDFQKFLIELSTNENDTVLDPFMGSGSCGEASILCNRNFIGIEQDEEYYNYVLTHLNEVNKNVNHK